MWYNISTVKVQSTNKKGFDTMANGYVFTRDGRPYHFAGENRAIMFIIQIMMEEVEYGVIDMETFYEYVNFLRGNEWRMRAKEERGYRLTKDVTVYAI